MNIFSNFDLRIILAFILAGVISLLFFFVKLDDHIDCESAKFFVIADKFATNKVIQFDAEVANAKTWEWDFGDGSPIEKRQHALHKYERTGVYTVKLTINGYCKLEKQIEIKTLGEIINQARVPKIIVPQDIKAGESTRFDYTYNGEVFSWEWSFGETGRLDNTGAKPAYTFRSPGKKTISLIINGDVSHIARVVVFVKPREIVESLYDEDVIEAYTYEKDPEIFTLPQGSPQKDPMEEFLRQVPVTPGIKKEDSIKKAKQLTLAPSISEEQFELMLLQVASQAKTKEDFAAYLCNHFDIPVIRNQERMITFSEFCKSIMGKEIRIERLRLTRDNLNCIDGLSIDYKVKKFMRWSKNVQ